MSERKRGKGRIGLFVCVFICLGSWHINLSRLFNAKFIFIHVNSSISNNSMLSKIMCCSYLSIYLSISLNSCVVVYCNV